MTAMHLARTPASRRLLLLLLAALLAAALPAAGAGTGPTPTTRLYLLQSDAGFQYWGVDPSDPELDGGSVTHTAGPTPLSPSRPESFAQITFAPGSVLAEPLQFGPDAPLRFRLALEVAAAAPAYTVTLALQKAGREVESAPAVAVAPGVWTGTLSAPGSLGGDGLDMLVVRVRSLSPLHHLELATGGSSWVDLPRPVGATSVPQLLAASPAPDVERVYTSATRRVALNDDAWTVHVWTGDLGAVRTFNLSHRRAATAVMAWVDLPDTPPLSEPLHGRAPNPRVLTDSPLVVLQRDGTPIATGSRSATAVAVEPGALRVEVRPSATSQATPYVLHLLTLYGERTLRHLRWRAPATPTVFTQVGGTCGGADGVVPTTTATTTFSVDVDAASPNPTSAHRWSPSYSLPGVGEAPCAAEGAGDEVRITVPGLARAWPVGATPQRGLPVVSAGDTLVDIEARLSHTAAR